MTHFRETLNDYDTWENILANSRENVTFRVIEENA